MIRRATVPTVSDAGDGGVLEWLNVDCRAYRNVLPATARWLGQPVPRCTFRI